MNDPHQKVFNRASGTNAGGKNRVRYQSQRKRAREATADVYRSYKRRAGSAAVREERVHHCAAAVEKQKSKTKNLVGVDDSEDETHILKISSTTFASELDIAMDRNASEIFGKLHRELWYLVRSLPEILHNASKIVNLLLMFLLSPEDMPGEKTPLEDMITSTFAPSNGRNKRYVINQATTDVLHLLAVLARDLRHEIHPYLHTQILPRILYDFLSPPPVRDPRAKQQPLPLDVSLVEAAFRTLSYIFRYDAERLLEETNTDSTATPCLEPLRRYYGISLAHRRPVVRRLAAEALAPLIRKLPSDTAKKRHLKRVLRALQQQQQNQPQNHQSASQPRLQMDAVDGIAGLLAEVARGAAGRLHSKGGRAVISCVLDVTLNTANSKQQQSQQNKTNNYRGRELVFAVATAFFERLAHHLNDHTETLAFILTTILRAATKSAAAVVVDGDDSRNSQLSLQYALRLVEQVASHRKGALLQLQDQHEEQGDDVVDQMEALLKLCLHEVRFPNMDGATQRCVLSLFVVTCKLVPENMELAERLTRAISNVLMVPVRTATASQQQEQQQSNVACVVVRDLLPHLRASISMSTIGKAVLSTAAELAQDSDNDNDNNSLSEAVTLVHAMATVPVTDAACREENHENENDHGGIFFLEHASACALADQEVDALLKACLVPDINRSMKTDKDRAKLMASCRAATFVTALGGDHEDSKRLSKNYKRVAKWFSALLQQLDEQNKKAAGLGKDFKIDSELVLSMAIDALSNLSEFSAGLLKDQSVVKACLLKIAPIVLHHLKQNPDRLWVLKSVSAFVAALSAVGLQWEDDMDAVFELLTPNLRDRNHFRRLHTLQILTAYSKRPFVVDHADLDLSEDLDEEASPMHITTDPQNKAMGPTGLCNIMELLLAVESTPANLQRERFLTTHISRVGVLGRTGKLPIVYAEAAVAHLLGVFYIKFTSLWAAAVQALVGLAKGHENCVWPALHQQIEAQVLDPPYRQDEGDELKNEAKTETSPRPSDPTTFYTLCADWETSRGERASFFDAQINKAEQHGQISRHFSADNESVFQSLWSVTEGAPQLIAAHSRTVVPIFIDFLQNQYFAAHPNDPDARELGLGSTKDSDAKTTQLCDLHLDSRALQRRLVCMLKAFASVNGPQQLFKHKFLLSIFVALLSHQDATTSQTALTCVLRFKLPYLVQVSDLLKNFYKKGKLRETLMGLKTIDESGVLIDENRRDLLPILSRILFGRFASRATGKKSSKDSPAARRTAVLSFLSEFCRNDVELYPFLYLMMRVYIPLRFETKSLENQTEEDRESSLERIATISPSDCSRIRTQIHQGFLNALGVVLSQFGHKVERFVPTFMSVLLALCKAYEVSDPKLLGDDDASSADDDGEVEEHIPLDDFGVERGGTIRSLCYRRLADVFSMFSEAHDLTQYSDALWGSLRRSLTLLPVMIINADKAPSLLLLLRTISGEKSLVPLLQDVDNAIPAALKCLTGESRPAIVDASLTFIDNLLSDGDGSSGQGRNILKNYIGLLLNQFRLRLGGKPIAQPSESWNPTQKTVSARNLTWRRELAILCRVSELMDEFQNECLENGGEVLESLCSLLIPFLDNRRGIADGDKLNVLDILDRIITKVPAEFSADHYSVLAILLGPSNAKQGTTSRDVKRALASVLDNLTASSFTQARNATKVLVDLCAMSAKRVDEMDYDRVIPALSSLGDNLSDFSWSKICKTDGYEPSILSPVLCACFNFLYDEDGVVSRTAFKALKTLIVLASDRAGQKDERSEEALKWKKLLEGGVVPLTRSGIASPNEVARKFFILLLSEIAKCNKDSCSPNLYGDLSCLIRDDEPDLDFFLNITHVQMHRRSRALQRLRNLLANNGDDSELVPLSSQSLSNILLPIATHPVYESKMKIEESFALEGIATVGAISRHLSWGKYNSILWTHLTQFDRHPEQEKYLIGLICAIIDAFHFDVVATTETTGNETQSSRNTAVWRALEGRIIPKIERLLVKEKVERNGQKIMLLRSPVVLAQLKLFRKLPTELFEAKLPRLLAVICNALRDRDSDARDVARTSLAKMVVEMDIKYLADVVRELATGLTEGYKLHVRMATLHSVLLELAKAYKPPNSADDDRSPPAFDSTVPALMDLIQQDLFGGAQERKDAQGNQVRFVKEAGGSKSSHALELVASMILFKPTASNSSIHAMVSPLLERLRNPLESPKVVRRIKESLSRIVSGLLKNPSLQTGFLLRFVHATLQPFVSEHEIASVMAIMDDGFSSDDEDEVKPIQVSGSKNLSKKEEALKKGELMEWRPSTLKAAKSTKAARDAKVKEEAEKARVRDGASAPKLTGSQRNSSLGSQIGPPPSVNDPATICAVIFGLQLLNPTLKKSTSNVVSEELVDPFVPLLTTCVCRCRDTDVVMLALRCLGWLLKSERLPSFHRCSKSLATKTLELLISAGANQELLQATFKMLTLLIQYDRNASSSAEASHGERVLSLPLDDEQMQVLISFLQESVLTSDQHSAAIALTKAIMSRRYLSAEMYDLMETMLKQSVRSPTSTLRDRSGQAFLHYLLNYPLAEARIEQHLKQVVLNLNYEHMEGRLSAISLATSMLEKLPVPLVEKHCQLFFLPLTLQLANDESKECREACAKCLSSLLKRLSTEVLRSIYGYLERWSQRDAALKRTSLQLYGIVVESRTDFIKRGDTIDRLFSTIHCMMEENTGEWEIIYFSLILLEKIGKGVRKLDSASAALWEEVVDSMTNSHSWIRLTSTRLLSNQLQALDPKTFVDDAPKMFFVNRPGTLYLVAKNLCFQIGAEDDQHNDDLTALVVKSLTWVIQAMRQHRELCFDEKGDHDASRDPVLWVITRLSNIARPKGTKRRQAVFKCFAAFASYCGNIIFDYLDLMLEPLHRTESETRNELEAPLLFGRARPANDSVSQEAQLAKDVLHLLEETCGDEHHEDFMKAYAAVKMRAREKKEKRRLESKTEAVLDPQNAAKERILKQDREKKRRKRRVEESRMGRGVKSHKRRYL